MPDILNTIKAESAGSFYQGQVAVWKGSLSKITGQFRAAADLGALLATYFWSMLADLSSASAWCPRKPAPAIGKKRNERCPSLGARSGPMAIWPWIDSGADMQAEHLWCRRSGIPGRILRALDPIKSSGSTLRAGQCKALQVSVHASSQTAFLEADEQLQSWKTTCCTPA